MSSSALNQFSCLDELIQVIYQNAERFVVMSNVSYEKWCVHVGISGAEGRWWHGAWTEADVLQIVGSKSSDKILESFAEKLADAFVQGEMYVGNWSTEKGANINLTIGPTSKRPMQIPLTEMSTKEAASHATEIFLDIALQAQSRKCRLHPSSMDYSAFSLSSVPLVAETKIRSDSVPGTSHARPIAATTVAFPDTSKATESQPSDRVKKGTPAPSRKLTPATTTVLKSRKGASLANPNKKARKYKEIEFASDEE
ncbi:hypothetical protein BDQ17DRAFT_1310975 [Cyathus striatus]|nr:hypothetical protein BDQ17DRAFT_1310975 [Cyathus striatus]